MTTRRTEADVLPFQIPALRTNAIESEEYGRLRVIPGRVVSEGSAAYDTAPVSSIAECWSGILSNNSVMYRTSIPSSDKVEPLTIRFLQGRAYSFGIAPEVFSMRSQACLEPLVTPDFCLTTDMWSLVAPYRNAQPSYIRIHDRSKLAKNIAASMLRADVANDDLGQLRQAAHEAMSFADRYLADENPTVFISEEGFVNLQWRGQSRGLLLIFTGDRTATYSIKQPGTTYAENTVEFMLSAGLPQPVRDAIRSAKSP